LRWNRLVKACLEVDDDDDDDDDDYNDFFQHRKNISDNTGRYSVFITYTIFYVEFLIGYCHDIEKQLCIQRY
jgi:hypothetical protein